MFLIFVYFSVFHADHQLPNNPILPQVSVSDVKAEMMLEFLASHLGYDLKLLDELDQIIDFELEEVSATTVLNEICKKTHSEWRFVNGQIIVGSDEQLLEFDSVPL